MRALPAVVAALLLAAGLGAGAARPATVVTVKARTLVHLAGTRVYCIVEGDPVGVVCGRYLHGLSQPPAGLYAVASDTFVAVDRAGASKPVRSARNAPTVQTVGVITGGRPYKSLTLGLHQAAYVSGSRMTLLVEPAVGGGNAIGVLFLDSQARPVPGSYSFGISERSVTLIGVTLSGAPKVVYRHVI